MLESMFSITADPVMPPIPLPEVFKTINSWSYSSGSTFVSPALGTVNSVITPDITDPDVLVIDPPDRHFVFNVPQGVEYVLVPPEKGPTRDDPTGLKSMMEFLGFKDEYVTAATGGFAKPDATGVSGGLPGGPSGPGTGSVGVGISNSQPSAPNPVGQMSGYNSNPPNFPLGPVQNIRSS